MVTGAKSVVSLRGDGRKGQGQEGEKKGKEGEGEGKGSLRLLPDTGNKLPLSKMQNVIE